jgi:uncharacterized protein (TIGR02996 family)
MTEEGAFLTAICERPDDDAPRLIFADWLEERGDPRGEFIRVQCALSRMDQGDKRRLELNTREKDLVQIHREEWETPLRALGAREITFRRGFPDYLAIDAADFIAHGGELLKLVPGRGVRIVGCTSANVAALVRCPHLGQLTSLNLWGNDIGVAGAEALAASSHLANLTSLNLWNNGIGNTGAAALAASANLAHLTSLNLWSNRIGDAGAVALAASPHLAQLTRLDLWGNDIGDAVEGYINRTMEARRQRRQNTRSEGPQYGQNPGGRER